MDFGNGESQETVSEAFDSDFIHTDNLFHHDVLITEAYAADHPIKGEILHLEYADPLKYASSIQFEPLDIRLDTKHFVTPHEVSGYERQDGTRVDGYYRDGDADTSIDRTVEQGGGYFRE